MRKTRLQIYLSWLKVKRKKVGRLYIVYGMVGFPLLYLTVGWGNDFLCNLIGFIYPAYATANTFERSVKVEWLVYWIIYSLLNLIQYFKNQLLFWIPFYSLFKCVFLIWLMVSDGTNVIYNRFLKPFILKYHKIN